MPIPIPLPGPTNPTTPASSPIPNSVYYVRETQDWAIVQERMRHNQALYMIGEYTMFTIMWHIEDFEAGLVDRCHRCYKSFDKVADAYGQSSQNKCPDCFGTTFEGGFKAQIIRPSIFEDTDEGEKLDRRGVDHGDDVGIETTTDFRLRNGDYVFRQDGSRWYLRVPDRVTVRTGFAHPYQSTSAITYNNARAQLEDLTSVVYLIPPPTTTVNSILTRGHYTPEDFAAYETIRAPLIPVNDDAIEN